MNFRKKKSSEEISGFLDQGTHLTGELQYSGTMQIDGNFHGSIATNDTLLVGEHAIVHADIKVGSLEIHGRIFGNIEAKRRVELYSTGRVRGDIHTPVLIISAGSVFDGRCQMAGENQEEGAPENRSVTPKGLDETY
jgi:cytoskeletal protein CcmA (bactofilin family)